MKKVAWRISSEVIEEAEIPFSQGNIFSIVDRALKDKGLKVWKLEVHEINPPRKKKEAGKQ